MTKGTRGNGEFCWFNMLTPQPAKAQAFFKELLGWTYSELPGVGHIVQVDGHDVGGMFDVAAPQTPPGTPPQIGVMVKVESADATAKKAQSLGGTVRQVFDVFDHGRLAVIDDPNGANIDVWEARKHVGADVDSQAHGAPTWFETMTSDVAKATKFYTSLFGWTTEVKEPVPGMKYTLFKQAGKPVGGLMGIVPSMGPVKPHWAVNFAVRDVDAAASTATRLGAKITVPPTDIPTVGRFCGIASPQGVAFYVLKWSMPMG